MMFTRIAVSLAVAGGCVFAAAPAQAHVSLSFGIEAPVFAPPPVYVEPPPAYYPPPRAYYEPPPVYVPAPRYYAEPPVVYGSYPGYYRSRGGWNRGNDRDFYEHRRWHEQHRDRGHRDYDDRD